MWLSVYKLFKIATLSETMGWSVMREMQVKQGQQFLFRFVFLFLFRFFNEGETFRLTHYNLLVSYWREREREKKEGALLILLHL